MTDALLVASQHADAKFFEPASLNGGALRSGSFGAIFGSLSLPQGSSLGPDVGRSQHLTFHETPGVLAPENRAGLDAHLCSAQRAIEQLAKLHERAVKVRQFREETQWLAENRNQFSGKWVA